MRKWFQKYIDPIVPLYAIFPLLLCLTVNNVVYFGIRLFQPDTLHRYDFTLPFDRAVPFVPAWVSVYLACYVFWVVNYILVARVGREHYYRFAMADLCSRLICAIFFIFLPTTNVRPQIVGSGIWESLMRWLYSTDAPTNLFPSIHCMVSWLCVIGIRDKKIPRWYQWFSCAFALLVCASTQFTKQHYIVDVFGGILIAEVMYHLWMRIRLPGCVTLCFDAVARALFGQKNETSQS